MEEIKEMKVVTHLLVDKAKSRILNEVKITFLILRNRAMILK